MSPKAPFLISVVIPVFNREAEVRRAVQSLREQTWKNWEAILVDDHSENPLASAAPELLQDPRITILRHERNLGVSWARNTGIEAARAQYIAFLDSDDRWLPSKLERQIRALIGASDPTNAICLSGTTKDIGHGRTEHFPAREIRRGEDFGEYLYVKGEFVQASSFLLSRTLAARIGFEPVLRQYEDHLFFLKAGHLGAQLIVVSEPLTIFDDHPRSGRLGTVDSLDRGRIFIVAAGSALSVRARLAFELRYLGQELWRSSPRATLALFATGIARGAMSPRFALTFLIRMLTPQAFYCFLQGLWRQLRASKGFLAHRAGS